MTYQVLARKWRPQEFSSLIGQEPIVTALRNGLTEERIAQAYLFSGIRGIGKTTAARILAKALNCERKIGSAERPVADPCNECPTCQQITAANDIDFLEVDAATYSKVEQVRELTESLRYGPAQGRYKVVVLDEVHRLSRQAFDALLKIVEEPPPHLVFIFATTEIDSVPATILSRCQEFQFRRVPSPVMAEHLRRISDAEGIEVSDAALRLIARAGEGSVRDSVALLDQLATFGNHTIADGDAKDLLGGLDTAVFLRLLEAILNGQGSPIAEIVAEIEATGWNPHSIYGQFLIFARDALELAMGGRPEAVDLPLEEAEKLAALVRPQGYENLLRLAQLLLDSEPTVRRSEFGMLAVELAWLRAAEIPKVVQIEDLLSGRAPAPTHTGSGGAPPRPSGTPRSAAPRTAAPPPAAPRSATPRPPSAAVPAAAQTEASPPPRVETGPTTPGVRPPEGRTPGRELLPSFLELLQTQSPSLAALFNTNRGDLDFDGGELRVPEDDPQLAGALKRPHNRELFERLLHQVWGEGAAWSWHHGSRSDVSRSDVSAHRRTAARPTGNGHGTESTGAEPGAPGPDDETLAAARQDPTVRAILEVFDGSKIRRIETRPQGEPKP